MSIKLLEKSVYNKISAGEVVEKPASIVKELLENSIDAGAKNITIEIEDGGIKSIKVADDGCGIRQEEVKLAFMPHATSKLEKIEDVYNLNTMGFRGEALASISAVSNVEIITKTQDEDLAVKVRLDAGEEQEREEFAANTGTTITVSNLFFNTPARAKFLRKPKTEENDITNYVQKLILSHSNINFKYYVDGKLVYNTKDLDLEKIVYMIYGKEVYESLLKVDYKISGYSVTGFISKPNYFKSNRTYQSFYVNGRYCQNILVSTAVQNAYENFLMKGKFPFYILFLEMPKNSVDVNVHPNKLEVKFENTNIIYSVFNNAIYETLTNFSQIKRIDDYSEKQEEAKSFDKSYSFSFNQPQNVLKQYSTTDSINNNAKEEPVKNENDLSAKLSNLTLDEGISFKNKENNSILNSSIATQEINLYSDDEANRDTTLSNNQAEDFTKLSSKQDIEQEKLNFFESSFKLCGKIFNTYLILEKDDKVFLIDQHAAHERDNYDKIMKEISSNTLKIQPLLVPYSFSTSNEETNYLNDNLQELKNCGFDISQTGDNYFSVYSVPSIISNLDIKSCFETLLQNLNKKFSGTLCFNKEQFMQQACKSAVKGGDDLKDSEIASLLNEMMKKKSVLLCPHGRPIVVELDKKQIEKWFKRIV